MSNSHSKLAPALLALFAPAAFAQGQVWVVDDTPGHGVDFNDLQTAIDAAADGDLLLVRDGRYAGLVAQGRALTIAAEVGESVIVQPQGGSGWNRVSGVPAGQHFVLRGLTLFGQFDLFSTLQPVPALDVADSAGTVWIEQCVLDMGSPALRVADCAEVVVQQTTGVAAGGGFTGFTSYLPGDGLAVLRSTVALSGGGFVGGPGGDGVLGFPSFFPQAGGAGCRLVDGVLRGGASGFSGGPGGDGFPMPGDCVPPAAGGPGLVLATQGGAPPAAFLASVQRLGGPGGQPGPGCVGAGPAGPAEVISAGGLVASFQLPPELTTSSPAREGQTFSATVTSAGIGFPFFAFLGLSVAPELLPVLDAFSPLLVGSPTLLFNLGIVKGGSVTFDAPVPELGPGFQGMTVFFQSATCVFGCQLGGGSSVLLLDGSF